MRRRLIDCVAPFLRLFNLLARVFSARTLAPAANEGCETCVEALQRFFAIEPGYHLRIETVSRNGDDILITGRATANDPRFASSERLRARADERHLHEWQSYSPVQGLGICRLLAGEKAELGSFPAKF